MARQRAGDRTAVSWQACFTHGSFQPYHAPEAQPYHGDGDGAGQDHEDSAKPTPRGLHPGSGQRTPHSEGTSPSALGSRRLGQCWHERMAHDRVAAGLRRCPAGAQLRYQPAGRRPPQPASRADGSAWRWGAGAVRSPRPCRGDSGISGVGPGRRQAGRARRGRAVVGGRRSPGPGPGRRARPRCRWPVRSRR